MRFDLNMVAKWIQNESKVLDLGCGQGDLLHFLKHEKGVIGTGIENDEEKVTKCVEKGLSVIQGDIYNEIEDYPDHRFDYVILSQTLQQVYEPEGLINEMLRIGKKGIVSFPNIGNLNARSQLFFLGRAPMTKQLPFHWYNTPNIRILTLKDFKKFCNRSGFKIISEMAVFVDKKNNEGKIIDFMPNLFASYGVYLLAK